MDPYVFYAYINELMVTYNYTKYNAIMRYIEDPTVDHQYKILDEVEDELHNTTEYQENIKYPTTINKKIHIKKLKNKN